MLAVTKKTKIKSHSLLLHFDKSPGLKINTSKRHELVELIKFHYFQCTLQSLKIYGLLNNLDEYLTKIGDRNGDGIPHDCYMLSEERQDTIVESLVSPEPDDSTLLQ